MTVVGDHSAFNMKPILVIALAIGLVTADIGYQYKVPQTSYGLPSYQVGSSSSGINNQGLQGSFGQQSGFQSAGISSNAGQYQNAGTSGIGLSSGSANVGYQNNDRYQNTGFSTGSSGVGFGSGSSNVGYQNTGFTGLNSGASNSGFTGLNSGASNAGYDTSSSGISFGTGSSKPAYQNNGFAAGSSNSAYYTGNVEQVKPAYQTSVNGNQAAYQTGYQTESQYQTSQAHKYQYNYIQQQPAQVFKHFYVHAAPEETEPLKPRQPIVLPAPQKHYKIIFIKTPSQAGSSSQYFPVQQQNEEKTIVYVLVNKPEGEQNIQVPKLPPPKPPTKPEVYFIKYNTKEGSQGVINNIVNGYNMGSNSVSYSETDVTGSDASQGLAQSLSSNINAVSGEAANAAIGLTSGSVSGSSENSVNNVADGTANNIHNNLGGGTAALEQVQYQSSGSSGDASNSDGTLNTVLTINNSASTESTIAASTLGYYPLAASQGVPHQTYGPPKFREASIN